MIKADIRFKSKGSNIKCLRKLLHLVNHFGFALIAIGLFLSLLPSGDAIAKKSDGSDKATMVQMQESYGKIPLYFIENNGQIAEKVKFYEKGGGHTPSLQKKVCIYH